MTLLLYIALMQGEDLLKERIESASRTLYGLEHSEIRDLAIHVKGTWGETPLEDFNRTVYWLNSGSARHRPWSSGTAVRRLTDDEQRVRTTLDRVIWSFLSNRADDQALLELNRKTQRRHTVERDGDLTKVSWKRAKGGSQNVRWFNENGRLVRASGTMMTYQGIKIISNTPWNDRYTYAKVHGRTCLTTLTLDEGELKAEWKLVGGELLPVKITGTLKKTGTVTIDLTAAEINKNVALKMHESRGN